MSDLLDLLDELARLRRDHERLRADYDATFVQGVVTDRDHDKGVRIAQDKEGKNKSDWTQPADGTGNSRQLPRKGDQVLILRPHGDARQGIAIGLGHSDERKNPAKDADNTVLIDRDGVRLEGDGKGAAILTATKILLKAGDVSVEVTGSGVKISGGRVEHDGKNIGKDHRHGQTQPGGGQSGEPT